MGVCIEFAFVKILCTRRPFPPLFGACWNRSIFALRASTNEKHGGLAAMQERIGYDSMDHVMDGDGPTHEARYGPSRRRWCCGLGGPQTQLTLFIVAQPVTTFLWILALQQNFFIIQGFFDSHSHVFGMFVFIVVFSALVIVLFPLGVIDLATGYLFGLGIGLPVALGTKTFGSMLSFLISRQFFGDYIHRTLVERYDWFGALSLMMRERPFQTMALLRFSVLPAALKNYGCGGLSVSLGVFTVATAMSLSVESSLLVPVGARFESLAGMMHRRHTPQEKAVLALGVALLIALILTIRRTVRLQIEKVKRDVDSRGGAQELDALEEVTPKE